MDLADRPGIIPRAAAMLFDKLEGAPMRASGSGIRAPSRSSSFANRPAANKNWQLKATYVEVKTLALRPFQRC